MKDIPIIFSGPMVRALLDGRKTMTRRMAWRPARKGEQTGEGSRLSYVANTETGVGTVTAHQRPSSWRAVQPGDRLWVRENFSKYDYRDGCWYWADGREAAYDAERPRPSIHMPRWASRLTLIVTGSKVERLQDISKADVMAEGIHERDGAPMADVYAGWHEPFAALWISLHGSESWDQSPEVVAISFEVVKANIDATEAKAAA